MYNNDYLFNILTFDINGLVQQRMKLIHAENIFKRSAYKVINQK